MGPRTSVAWIVVPYRPPTRRSTHQTYCRCVQTNHRRNSCQSWFPPAACGKLVKSVEKSESASRGAFRASHRIPRPSPHPPETNRPAAAEPPRRPPGSVWQQAMADYEHRRLIFGAPCAPFMYRTVRVHPPHPHRCASGNPHDTGAFGDCPGTSRASLPAFHPV